MKTGNIMAILLLALAPTAMAVKKRIVLLAGVFMLLTAHAQTYNKMDYRTLIARQLHLATCAALEAQGDMTRLEGALHNALDEGVTVNELKETFSQLYAYTGFPRSLNALQLLLSCYLNSVIGGMMKTSYVLDRGVSRCVIRHF